MDVVIFGTGEVADVFHYYLTRNGDNVEAFTVDREYVTERTHLGLPVIPFEDLALPPSVALFIGMSFKGVNSHRERKFQEAKGKGYTMVGYCHGQALVWDGLKAKANQFIMEANVIQPYSQIGENTIVWSGNHIGHHTHIGDNVFIASHAVISGHVTIGDNTFIGVNATLRDGITIGKRCVIGAGALVLHDLPDESVVSGLESKPRSMKSSELRSI